MRRANHDKVVAPNLTPCSNCNEPVLSHRVCPSCGYYKGKSTKKES
jgi:large subunit ribosomal protein L32